MSDDEPKGLPPLKEKVPQSAASRVTHCPKCEKELRVVSNYQGVRAHCDSCKDQFPVSSSPRRVEPAMNLPRGLHKRTLVEPDWGKAFEEMGNSNEQD